MNVDPTPLPTGAQQSSPGGDAARSLQLLALQFSHLLTEIAQLHRLEAETRGMLANLPGGEGGIEQAQRRARIAAWAEDCAGAFGRIGALGLGCADLLEWHGQQLATHLAMADLSRRKHTGDAAS